MAAEIGVGLIGYNFMGKAHSQAYRNVHRFFDPLLVPRMAAICGRNEGAVKEAADKFGWESYETRWQRLIRRDDIGLVDICTPNDSHHAIAVAAANAGKNVYCEKPLARTVDEAEAMLKVVERAKVKHAICYNYRRCPAVGLAKRLINEGRLGEVFHFRGTYLQDWIVDPDFPLVWRLQKRQAGSGAHGDLAAHMIDLARFLVGEIIEVSGLLHTFIKERPTLEAAESGLAAKGGGETGRVTVDDASLALVHFGGGALGSIEATRFAPGRKNFNRFEINGSNGSLVFNLERMNELEVYFRDDPPEVHGFRTIMVTDPDEHPFIEGWWPPGHIIGYEHPMTHTVLDLLNAIADDKMPTPNFYDGVQNQRVLEAIEKSSKTKSWQKVRVLPEFKS